MSNVVPLKAPSQEEQIEAVSKLAHQAGACEAVNEVLRWAYRHKPNIPARALEELAALAVRFTSS
jgi:hypothetical protein